MIVRIVIGVVLLVVLAGGGAAVALAEQPPTVAAGLKAVTPSTRATESFDAKVDTLRAAQAAATRTGKSQPVELTFTEEELTSKADETSGPIGDTGIAATGTQIHLSGGNLVATSTLSLKGVSMSVGVIAKPVVANGQVQLVVTQVQTGALPLPDGLRRQINAAIGQALDPTALGLPLDVSELTILDGTLVLKGAATP